MTGRAETEKLNWPRWQQALLIALLALLIGNRMIMLVDSAAARAGITGAMPMPGMTTISDPDKPGYHRVIEVVPGSAMARAGVMVGDRLASDPPNIFSRRPYVGERIDFTLDRQGVRSARHAIIEPMPLTEENQQQNTKVLLNNLAVIVSMLIGCAILWRGWGNKTAMLLGTAMVTMGVAGINLPPWAIEPWLAVPMIVLIASSTAGVHLLLPFAMRIYEENARPVPRWHWQVGYAWLALMACYTVAWVTNSIALTSYLGGMGGYAARLVVTAVSLVASIAYLVAGWRNGAGAPRNRMALIALALLAYALGITVMTWMLAQTGTFLTASWLGYVNALTMGLIAPGALAYAVLRHKLFDLGFAVNRTLVFGAIGGLLLVSFALIEWAIKQAIPKVWYGGSVYISAGIAVSLYLLFNRIHHKVEHAIERLFFHKWQLNEQALRRFVRAAAHVEKPEALAGNFVAELVRFTGGADVALYARTAEGHYADASGATIDADDPALAAMRAEQGAVVPVELGSSIEAALALPMMHQAALAGFVLLGPKPTGEDYRPDEIEVLSWATQQVGLDLQAIRVRDLELTNLKLVERNRTLSEILTSAALAKA